MYFLLKWLILSTIVKFVLSKGYLINTTGCKIPNFQATYYDAAESKPSSCGRRYVTITRLPKGKIKFEISTTFDSCCFKYIHRSTISFQEDDVLIYSDCEQFTNNETFYLESDLIKVDCHTPSWHYVDYYALAKKRDGAVRNNDNSYNVLLMGIDTMSRARVYSSMKKTVKFFKKNRWLDFQGFNKMALNTRPNLIATLTGLELYKDFVYLCEQNLDECNDLMIWNHYKQKGYVTAMTEDAFPYYDTFLNIYKNISLSSPSSPTDHYPRPLLKHQNKKSSVVCIGKQTTGQHILSYALDYAKTYKNDKFFGYFWIICHSHDLWQSPKSLDQAATNFFNGLVKTGVLENTFVIFFSDHGVRYGPARYTIESFYDERLPMFFMHVPKRFKKEHPDKYAHLIENQRRLTSPYDLYLTIKDIIDLKVDNKAGSCKTCLSLFKKLSEYRSCADAGIGGVWCTCHTVVETSVKEPSALTSAVKAVSFIYDMPKHIITKPCTACKVPDLHSIRRIHSFSFDDYVKFYIISFSMKTGIIVEVVIRRTLTLKENVYTVVLHQSLSSYDGRGECVYDKRRRKFCHCIYFDC